MVSVLTGWKEMEVAQTCQVIDHLFDCGQHFYSNIKKSMSISV